jgi:hypothetical protein
MVKLLALSILLVGGVAHAEEPEPAQPPPRPAWMWSVGGLLRSTASTGESDTLSWLEEYGWQTQRPVMTGLRGDLAYLNAPIVDLGVAWAWARGTYAAGPAFDDPDRITGSSTELGVFARIHWVPPRSPVAAEPRVEAGLARENVDMRGARESRLTTYTRVGLDFRAGGRKAGVLFSVDYTSIHESEEVLMQLPAGGINFALSFYWRHWPS